MFQALYLFDTFFSKVQREIFLKATFIFAYFPREALSLCKCRVILLRLRNSLRKFGHVLMFAVGI